MKKTFVFLLFVFCFLYSHLFAQTITPTIQWQNTIGGNYHDECTSVQQTNDGGYILGGVSTSEISGDKSENTIGSFDYWLVKTDAQGNIQWQNDIGGSNADYFSSVLQTSDGGFFLSGNSNSGISGDKTEWCLGGCSGNGDFWIVKTDGSGNIQWQNTIGANDDDGLISAQQTTDGGYILGGWSRSSLSGDKTEGNMGIWPTIDYWIVKVDSVGNIQWQNTIGGDNPDNLQSILQTNDGGYILGGYSDSNISIDKTENCLGLADYWIIKTDVNGNIQWQNTIGGSGYETFSSVRQTNDGGYLLGGTSNSNISGNKTENSNGGYDYWIVKTDALGNIQWQNTIGGAGDDKLRDIKQTSDGGYLLGGYSLSNISGDKTENNIGQEDYWVVKTNSLGNIQWQKTIGGSDVDYLYSITQTSDGGYFLGGTSKSGLSGNKTEGNMGLSYTFDYWVVKLSPECTACPKPTNPFTTVLSHIKAKLNWTTQPCAIGYKIRIRKIGTTAWTNITVGTNVGFRTVSNLIPNTAYEWQVRSICQQTPLIQSAFTSLQTFTTPLRLEDESVTPTDFIIYPNPSSNTINISSSTLSGKYSLKIYNLLGQQVKQQEIDFSFEGSSKVNIESLASGYYQLMLVNGSNVVSKRFVKE